ncbi:unnamed protein product [Effrenium voratum]|nr:unnamed protein product [Effrenium voratum]
MGIFKLVEQEVLRCQSFDNVMERAKRWPRGLVQHNELLKAKRPRERVSSKRVTRHSAGSSKRMKSAENWRELERRRPGADHLCEALRRAEGGRTATSSSPSVPGEIFFGHSCLVSFPVVQ